MAKKTFVLPVLVSLILCLFAAEAQAFGEIRYPDRPLNLRQKRDADSGWVGLLRAGQKVRIAWVKDGWAAIFEPWMTDGDTARVAGYANTKYLKKRRGKVEEKPWGEWRRTKTKLNYRSGPERGAKRLGVLDSGVVLRTDFPEDGWVAVFEPKATIRSRMNSFGWVKEDYLATASRPSTKATSSQIATRSTSKADQKPVAVSRPDTSEPSSADWGRILRAPMELNLRRERAGGSKYATTIPKGQAVKVDFLKEGWYAVFSPSAKVRKESRALGYVLRRLIEPEAAGAQPTITSKADSGRKTIVIPRKPTAKVHKAAPKVDKRAHGFRYGVMERAQSTMLGVPVEIVKVYLEVDRLPKAQSMRDFANTLWKEFRTSGRELRLEIYLPEMNLDGLSFISARYTYQKEVEFWARKATLYGTRFLD